MFSIIKGPLKQKLATKYYKFLNFIVFENLCSIYSFKKLLNPEKVGNIEKFREKKGFGSKIRPWFPFPIPQPCFGCTLHAHSRRNPYSWKNEKTLWNLATFTALDQDRTLLSKKVLIILSFICGLTPSQIRELKLKDLYKDHNSGNLCLRLKQSSKTEKTCQIPSEKYSKVVTQYFDRIYEDTGSAEG